MDRPRLSRQVSVVLTRAGALLLLWAALLACGAGCGRSFVITTPAGFAELPDQEDYGYRAADAAGVVLAVRHEENAPFGDLAFWSGAIDAHLRRDGYVADQALDVKSADGVPGRQIRYHRVQQGRKYVFWATVFVTDDSVVTIETGGDGDHFDERVEAVTAAIRSVAID